MAYATIEEYNTYLVENQINVNIIDFVKEVNNLEFKIDISFIDEFIELVSKNECCIHHNMLEKYEILKLNKGTYDVKIMLKQNNFIENKEYQLRNVPELRPQGGSSIKNEYYLHPRAFKICLMRSKNKKEYAYYYILLEECIKYYNDYQIELNKKYIIKLKEKNKKNKIIIKEKDDKIDKLEKLMMKANIKLDEVLDKLDEVHEELETTNTELEETNDKLDNTDKNLKMVAKKLDIAVEDRVVKTRSKLKNESFVIMYNSSKSYKYQVIKSKNESLNSRIEKFKSKNYEIIKDLSLYNVPNASILWCLIKEELKNDIDYCGSRLNLKIDETQFNIKINEIYNKRKTVVVI